MCSVSKIDYFKLYTLSFGLVFLSACSIVPTSIFDVNDKTIDLSQLTEAQQKHYELSLHYIESAHFDVAQSKLEAIVLEYPTFPDAYNALGVIDERRGKVSNALDLFLKAIALNPEYNTAIENYGNLKCYLAGGRGIEEDAERMDSDRVKSRLYTVATRCYINGNNYVKANDVVQRAISYDDTYAMSYLELAKISLQNREIQASRISLDRFNDLNGYTQESANLGLVVNRHLNDQAEIEKYQHVLATQFKNKAL